MRPESLRWHRTNPTVQHRRSGCGLRDWPMIFSPHRLRAFGVPGDARPNIPWGSVKRTRPIRGRGWSGANGKVDRARGEVMVWTSLFPRIFSPWMVASGQQQMSVRPRLRGPPGSVSSVLDSSSNTTKSGQKTSSFDCEHHPSMQNPSSLPRWYDSGGQRLNNPTWKHVVVKARPFWKSGGTVSSGQWGFAVG
ncbi:hypothetical protein VTJ83DRAFT_4259 [Remersonia thermophila]|uniref:Uncharacterized protein n=1 Tax=Remersonia thermophila TaxID=72144 RepID=A0ABR4D9N2_9PEZI